MLRLRLLMYCPYVALACAMVTNKRYIAMTFEPIEVKKQ